MLLTGVGGFSDKAVVVSFSYTTSFLVRFWLFSGLSNMHLLHNAPLNVKRYPSSVSHTSEPILSSARCSLDYLWYDGRQKRKGVVNGSHLVGG